MPKSEEFDAVLNAELQQIDERRQRRGLADVAPECGAISGETKLERVRKKAHQRQLVGLAFSGGGIRSATFNLGFLQGLASLKMVKIFDYCSTVSGGGYIGAWWTAWVQRRAMEMRDAAGPGAQVPSAAAEVEDKLRPVQEQKAAAAPDKDKLDPIEHLRRHSNYLAPRQGFLSIDSWVLWALYLRNFLLNQLVLLPAAVIVLLLSRLVMFAYYPTVNEFGYLYIEDAKAGTIARVALNPWWCYALIAATTVLMTLALVNLVRAIHRVRQAGDQRAHPTKPGWLLGWVVTPLFLATITFCPLIPNALSAPFATYLGDPPAPFASWPRWSLELSLYMAIAAIALTLTYQTISSIQVKFNWVVRWWCFFTGLTWGAMLYGTYRLIDWLYAWDGLEPWLSLQISATAHMTTFGPPLMLLTVVLATSLAIGLLRKHIGEELREWLASLCGWLLRAATVWIGVNLVSLYGTPFVLWASPWAQAALGSGWLLTIAGGVLAGGSELTGASQPKNFFRDLVARISLPLFVIGIFLLVSLLVHKVIDKPPVFDLADEAIVRFRSEPEHPKIRESVGRLGSDGHVKVQRTTETLRVLDDADAIARQYWLGMLNTEVSFASSKFFLTDDDVQFLIRDLVWTRQLIDEDALKVRLAKLRPIRQWSPAPFWAELDNKENLGKFEGDHKVAVYEVKKSIFLAALRHGAYEPRQTLILSTATLGLLCSPQHGPWLAASAQFPGCAAKLEFKKKSVVDALEESDLPVSVKAKFGKDALFQYRLESNQYKQLSIEELQDEIDNTFPEAWHHYARRLIFQRANGGTDPGVKIEKSNFLFRIGGCLAACVLVLSIAASQVDVNAFSLHGLYLNRLVRAYLGASRKPEPVTGADPRKRKPDPFTGFDPDDDLPLAMLKSTSTQSYDGPYPIMNAAMNLVHGENLAWQERKAESFVLTPEYCGSETTGYKPTDGLQKYAGGVKVGTAVAISGAAASPNMGYHSSPAVTFLLTVFNARLGAWLGNPNHEDYWQDKGPRWGFLYLLRELFGWTDDTSPYVYLSDGGHFENLGAYELIKRRCRYVVICDAGEDGLFRFEDLGNLVRKVRVDLGIRIELSPDCLQRQQDSIHSRWHCAIGKIRYDEVDTSAPPGTLVYVKPSLTGDEPADVQHYAASHLTFPHETTANQFFTESQFESYRALGEHIAVNVFKRSVDDANESETNFPPNATPGAKHQRWCRELFASLVRRWFAMPPEYDANFVASTHGYIDLQEAWRNDPRLWRLTLDVYPELDPDGSRVPVGRETKEEAASRESAELHILLQMLQVIENAYLSLNLEKHYSHPVNRGWLDIFHRWTNSETFHRFWPTVRGEFARDFVHFCERQMRKGEVLGKAEFLDRTRLGELPDRLFKEFAKEWPDYKDEQNRNLEEAIQAHDTWTWAIYAMRASESHPQDAEATRLPVGLALVWPDGAATSISPKEYRLFVWQRGAYRNAGLGRPAVRQVLTELTQKCAHPFRLRVQLQISSMTGPGGKLQKAIWLTFFSQLDFVRSSPVADDEQETMLVLQRDFE